MIYKFADKISNASSIVLYGAGLFGKKTMEFLESQNLADKVLCFADSSPSKIGNSILGKNVEKFDYLKNLDKNTILIISINAAKGTDGIYLDLCKFLKPEQIFSSMFYWDIGWHYYPGAFNKNAIRNAEHISVSAWKRSFFETPMTEEMTEKFYKYYLPKDTYSNNILSIFFSMYGERYNPLISFQQYEICKNFAKEHPFNEFYFSEVDFNVKEEKTIFDIGAFDGDSFANFFLLFGDKIKKYYAFEPNEYAFESAKRKIEKSYFKDKFYFINSGVGNENLNTKIQGMNLGNIGQETAISIIDDLNLEILGKLYMKLDIEGFEINALEGAAKTIKKYKPNLAVCVYHFIDDVWRVPEYLKSLVPEYKFVLRGGSHMVCYASL